MPLLGLAAAMALGPAASAPPRPSVPTAEPVELSWHAPPSCPSVQQARQWIAQLTPSARPTPIRPRARVTLSRTAHGYGSRIAIETEGRRDTRQLDADDCTLLARATTVVIAVSLDPLAAALGPMRRARPDDDPATGDPPSAGSTTPPRPVPDPPRRARPGDAPPEPRSRSDAPPSSGSGEPSPEDAASRPPPRLEAGARLGAAVGAGLLPSVGAGLTLAPFLGVDRVHVRATVQYWARRRIDFDPRRDATAQLRMVTGGLRICPRLGRGPLRVPLCAGVDAGAVLGRGTGDALIDPRSARAPWVGAVLQPGLEWSITPSLSLWLALEGVVSLYRPAFAVEGAARAWTAGPGGLRGLVGLQLHRPRKKP